MTVDDVPTFTEPIDLWGSNRRRTPFGAARLERGGYGVAVAVARKLIDGDADRRRRGDAIAARDLRRGRDGFAALCAGTRCETDQGDDTQRGDEGET